MTGVDQLERNVLFQNYFKMIASFVKHKVDDFEAWKKVYEEFSKVRKEKGVIGASVLQEISDPETVIVVHEFDSLDVASRFFESEELKNAMKNAGVQGQPEIWIGNVKEHTPF